MCKGDNTQLATPKHPEITLTLSVFLFASYTARNAYFSYR